jgi:hypothetical protein
MAAGTSSSTAVLDSATRERGRLLVLFSLAGRIHPRDDTHGPLADRFDFGRFTPHLVAGAASLPVPVPARRLEPGEPALSGGDHGLDLGRPGSSSSPPRAATRHCCWTASSPARPRPPRSPPGWPTAASPALRSPSAAVPRSM